MQKQIQNFEPADVEITAISKHDLVDMSGFLFDHRIRKEQRMAYLLETVKNPYCFRVSDLGVKLEFSDNAPPFKDCFFRLLERKKNGLSASE